MELRQYFNTFRKWLWLIVLATLVATAASFLATRQQAPIYAAKTSLMVGQTLENPNPTGNDVWLGQQLAQTYAEIAKRDLVRGTTMEALGLSWLPEYTVQLVPNTQLLEIRVVDTNPVRAQAVAAELANQLILQSPSASDRTRQDRREFVTRQLQELETNIDETKARIDDLQQQLAGMFSARQIADTQTQINALEQKLNSYQGNYASLLSFLEGGVNTINVVEPATLPTTPIGPNKGMTILLAAAIGFLLAAGAAFLLDYLDDTLKTPDDIKDALDVTTLGAIARIEGDNPDERLVTALYPKSPAAEAFRVLRTNIQFSSLDNPPRRLMVTSSSPSEGKSTTLANLAVVIAQQGQRVVVLDTDLRRPTLHRIFQVPNNAGLTNALLQEHPSHGGFLQQTKIDNLQILTTGPLPPNPAELLSSAKFAALIESLQDQVDVLMFDSPPVMAVTDAAILARQMDGVVLVIDAGATRRDWAINAKESLDKVGAHILGVALNRLRPQAGGYYYYYYNRDYTYGDENNNDGRRSRKRSSHSKRRWLPRTSSGN
ncbi:MAG: polysaccharide biosynthesis tyrosine autokinase [Anaerolineae bacterium]|nr:polysaccharide biosynthesis tyrosine autokinase [Anaerolineae bacterium]MCB0247855.1 polysaccharide biosynthesis tyrosine autokinase [Anaerolineae bacterium]MCB9129497.1 polysaccharide biosynthesis tyrosine autokinase [Anaerolineales bacterium]MCO5242572.1 polysaccharide biosynthesis tyrosine autokinase [Anaerolineae bacterium]HRX01807.1 polysaccharide biosynthesis tyrosine autokinase [Anaerolineae bacterium]